MKKIKVYAHTSPEITFAAGKAAGLSDHAANFFGYFDQVELELDVDEESGQVHSARLLPFCVDGPGIAVRETIEDHIGLLGKRIKDKVTGFEGVVSSTTFDLYGCTQALITPGIDKDGEIKDSRWFDANRLEIIDQVPVMGNPFIGGEENPKKGPAEKPRHMKP